MGSEKQRGKLVISPFILSSRSVLSLSLISAEPRAVAGKDRRGYCHIPFFLSHGSSGTTNDFLTGLNPFFSIARALSSLTTSRFPTSDSISMSPASLLAASFLSFVRRAASFMSPFSS